MDLEIEYVINQKGHKTLIYCEYRYNKSKTNKSGSTLWRCVNRRECSASLSLDKTGKITKRKTVHTCEPMEFKNVINEHIASLKKIVCQDFRPIQQIYEEYDEKIRQKIPKSQHYLIPVFKTIRDTLYRARKSFLNVDRLQHISTETITVPEVLGRKFLIYEEGQSEKILVFATCVSKKILKKPGSYYADGTFMSAPPPFYQFYVLHLDINSTKMCTNIVPVIYTLLPNKSQETYTRLYNILKQKLGIIIKTFKCDYEMAQINAVKSVFPEAEITGCYRHYNA
ncbi:unnamed protein product, partial [Diatraea saccharalis]